MKGALNNSPSKLKYSFSKDQRFKDIRTHNNINAYDQPDIFKINKTYDADNGGFGSTL